MEQVAVEVEGIQAEGGVGKARVAMINREMARGWKGWIRMWHERLRKLQAMQKVDAVHDAS